MIVIRGGDVVLSDRVEAGGSVVLEDGRIVAVEPGSIDPAGADVIDAAGCYVAPGFVDVHVHGVLGLDTLDGHGALAGIAAALPRYGVTAFCPTTVACPPDALRAFLEEVRRTRIMPAPGSARVLPARVLPGNGGHSRRR